MADSSYVFESGEAIEVGSHGSTEYLYQSGDPVRNSGASEVVFESGTGLGAEGNITYELLQGSTVLATLSATDTTYTSGGIGFTVNDNSGQGTGARVFYDNYKVISPSSETVDTFSDGDISEYSVVTEGIWSVESGRLKGETSSGSTETMSSTSGLSNYPETGDTFECEVEVDGKGSGDEGWVSWAVQNEPPSNTGFPPAGYAANVRPADNAIELARYDANPQNERVLDSTSVSLSTGTTYTARVAWS